MFSYPEITPAPLKRPTGGKKGKKSGKASGKAKTKKGLPAKTVKSGSSSVPVVVK